MEKRKMKTLIPQTQNQSIFEKVITDECAKGINQTIDPHVLIQQFDFKNNWNLIVGWFYLLGFQRYQGNHSTQDFVHHACRGIRRFIKVLAAFNVNKAAKKQLFGTEACAVFIEKKEYDKFFSALASQFQADVTAWSNVLTQMGYTVFHDHRTNGDDKVVWMPTVYMSVPKKQLVKKKLVKKSTSKTKAD